MGRRSVEATHGDRGGAGPKTPRTREGFATQRGARNITFSPRTVISAGSQCDVADRVTSRKFESARKLRRLPLKRRKTRKTKCCPPPYTGYAPSYLQQCYHLGALTETQRPASWPRCSPERSAKKPAVARPKMSRTRDESCNPTRLTHMRMRKQQSETPQPPKMLHAKTKPPQALNPMKP